MATAPSCQSDDLNGITTREEGGVNEDGAVALQENTEGPSCGEPVHINTQGGNVQVNIEQHLDARNTLMHSSTFSIPGIENILPTPIVNGLKRTPSHGDNVLDNIEDKLKRRPFDLRLNLRDIGVSEDRIPVVHPRIYQFPFYQKLDEDREEKLSDIDDELIHKIREIKFCDFINETKEHRFVALLGFPGSGKTTCSHRLVEKVQVAGLVWFHFSFLDMDFKNEKITLKELIASSLGTEFNVEDCEKVFDWVSFHQEKVVLIMDGFDQVKWSLPLNCPRRHAQHPQEVQNIISGLINQHFLPKSRIIFTSRPHSMQNIPNHLRPSATYMIRNLLFDDMKTLFFGLCGSKAQSAWNVLETQNPQLMSMCLCPLILQLYIKVILSPSTRSGAITTTTRIFASVFEKLRRSEFTRNDNIKPVLPKLAKLAYTATRQGIETVDLELLRKVNLDPETVQDLIIQLQEEDGAFKVFEGKKKLYFHHQTFQEYFSALYIAHQLSVKKFKKLVKVIFMEEWSVRRIFLFGILFDSRSELDNTQTLHSSTARLNSMFNLAKWFTGSSSIERKKSILKKAIMKRVKDQQFHPSSDFLSLFLDAREANNDDISEEFASHLTNIHLIDEPSFTPTSAHALSRVISKVTSSIQDLSICGCNLDHHGFSYICDAIIEMPGRILKLDISENRLTDIKQICSVLHKIDSLLIMEYCFITEDGSTRCANSDEKFLLENAWSASENMNLKVVLRAHPLDELSNTTSSDRDDDVSSYDA